MRHWSFEEWKNWLDWLAKKKFNIFFCHEGQEVAWKKLWHSYGIKREKDPEELSTNPFKHICYGKPTSWDLYQEKFIKQILGYGRSIGLRTVCPSFTGEVPGAFGEKYPDAKYLEIKWGQAPTSLHLDPRDPLFNQIMVRFIKIYTDIYGTDHLYAVCTYSEVSPGSDPEEFNRIRVDFAKSAVKALRSVDPEAVWYMSGWSFWHPAWPQKDIEDFLAVIPDDAIYICDIDAAMRPQYKKSNYFYGKPWGFGVMHALGGHTSLHGDLAGLIRKVEELIRDPKADNCTYFYVNPEIQNHNLPYYELCMRLAWNPEGVELDKFLEEYTVLRYGEKSAPNMFKVLKELADSVYSTEDRVTPLYHYPLGFWEETSPERYAYILPLKNALQFALLEKDNLRENPLYNRDLIDISRQYLGELFSYHLIKAREAFFSRDKEAFEKEAKLLLLLLDNQEKVLSTNEIFCLLPDIKKQLSRPGMGPERARWVKSIVTYLGLICGADWDKYPWLVDYMKRDLYELVRFYYRPRMELYLNTLRERMDKGDYHLPTNEMRPGYLKITKSFIENPLVVRKEDRYPGTTLQAVEESFFLFKDEEIETVEESAKTYRETNPVVIADDKQTSFWQTGGDDKRGTISAPTISDDAAIKQSGQNSLKMVIKEGGSYRCWYIQHKYSPSVDWSDKDFLVFHWYGANSGGEIYICLTAPDWVHYYQTIFVDDFKGWKQLSFPLNSFNVYGNPSLKGITNLKIRSRTVNLPGTWYIDRVVVDTGPRR